MKAIVLALIVSVALAGVQDIGNNPIPSIVVGTSTQIQLNGKAGPANYVWKSQTIPTWAKLSTDGVLSCDAKTAGSYPVQVKVYDSVSGQNQSKQYILRVVAKPTEDNIWANKADNYYERASDNNTFKVSLGDAPKPTKTGDTINVDFKAQNGKGDLVYAFFGLPNGLTADRKTGKISGSVQQAGIYTLGCEVADQDGKSAEGFVTITVIGSAQTQLSTVQLQTKVSYNYNLADIRTEQVTADRELFDALAVVNAVKAKLAAKKAAFGQLEAQLALAETQADKAAANAAKAKAERERAAERLRLTNKALNDAQDQLNLALLDQAAASDAVIAAQDAVSKATSRFNTADAALKAAEAAVQKAEGDLSVARENLLKAENNLKNAQKQFGRASQDLSDAKDDLEKATRRKQLADQDVSKARDALKLAQQAYNDAKVALDAAIKALAAADAQRQKCLGNLADAKFALEQAKNDLGSAQWDLEKALASLYQAQARKEAADRSSALALAEGSTNLDGSTSTFRSLGGWQQDTSYNGSFIVQTTKDFGSCDVANYPRFAGSAKVVDIQGNVAVLSTGQQFTVGGCTQGINLVKQGAEIVLNGVVDTDKKYIRAFSVGEASL